MARSRPQPDITPELLLRAYSAGMFPMAESADADGLFWVDPEERGIFPLDHILVSSSLAKTLRSDRFEIVADRDFAAVIEGCGASAPNRPDTWINGRISSLFGALFRQGHVHTIEAYQDGELVGGLYGLAIGGAFFGESMFHRVTDASKACLVHLAARLVAGGFSLLDTQFVTPHLTRLGAIEIPRAEYRVRLADAIDRAADFNPWQGCSGVDGKTALAILAG